MVYSVGLLLLDFYRLKRTSSKPSKTFIYGILYLAVWRSYIFHSDDSSNESDEWIHCLLMWLI